MDDFPNLNPREFRELFAITEEMRLLRTDPSRLTFSDYKNLLTALCGTLSAARERGLERAIQYGSRLTNDPSVAEHARAIVSDMDAFVGFIEFERESLKACGASEESADAIAEEISGLREQLSDPGFDADAVIGSLAKGHDEICRAADAISTFADDEHQLHQDKKRALLTYGAAATIANAVGTAVTAGAGFPYFGLSIAGGGLLITMRGTLNDPLDKPPRR